MKIILSVAFASIVGVLSSQFSVSGKVTNAKGEPLEWATVFVEGGYGSSTNTKGEFIIKNLKAGDYELKTSFVGYETQFTSIEVTESITNLTIQLNQKDYIANEVLVTATRVNEETPGAYSTVTHEELEKTNLGQDIPFLLNTTPSIVVNSDAGAGIGYTGMRIRGTDITRINVTINGVPLNDPESHGVFWVNMPDFASSVQNIQVQRGAGTSTNGAGAFGASVNLLTENLSEKSYGELNMSAGSFNTTKATAKFGTGLIKNHWAFDGRLSSIQSDGYIDRATADLKSYYLSGQYVDDKNSLKFITFSGKEITYQAWGGVPEDSLETNRTYNEYTYDNEVDNYQQTHYQLFYNRILSENLLANVALHYTKGQGFFEQYREGDDLADYGIDPVITPNDTITSTDLIRRRWLDNDFYGVVYSLDYTPSNKMNIIFGGAINSYDGDHFGEVIWARFAGDSEIRDRYYDNNAQKVDINSYAKLNYSLNNKLSLFGDIQLRTIDYTFLGFDNDLNNVTQNARYTFVNPKAGFNYFMTANTKFYGLFAVANKEPNRDDHTESTPTSRPKHESLNNVELGYRTTQRKYALGINLYYMLYDNQLIPTGELNDVGASVRTNIKTSYRRGIEIDGGVQLTKGLLLTGNVALSQNKIPEWTEYVDNWDTWGKDTVEHTNTDIAFSPSIIATGILEFSPFKQWNMNKSNKSDFSISLVSKYVGRQYLDNTQSTERSLDPYFVNDLRFNYSRTLPKGVELQFFGAVNNLFNELYSANGWTYRYSTGGEFYQISGYYPQATTNFLIGLNLRFSGK